MRKQVWKLVQMYNCTVSSSCFCHLQAQIVVLVVRQHHVNDRYRDTVCLRERYFILNRNSCYITALKATKLHLKNVILWSPKPSYILPALIQQSQLWFGWNKHLNHWMMWKLSGSRCFWCPTSSSVLFLIAFSVN